MMILSEELYSGKIIELVKEQTRLDIQAKTRKREYVEARALCYTLMREHLRMSYWLIGHMFGLTHATIMHAVDEFPYMMKHNPSLRNLYLEVNLKIENMKAKLSPREKREYILMDEVLKLREENRALRLKMKNSNLLQTV